MERSLEIRKLPPSYIKELVSILEANELWKRLMAIIPKILIKDNYVCNSIQRKYNSEHFKLIESTSEKSRKPCTEILFEEWSTSGTVRPTLGHLLYLLEKAEVFRAADYVALILNEEKPRRPEIGPAALISTKFPTTSASNLGFKPSTIETMLDEINYPSLAVNMIQSNLETNKKDMGLMEIPQIVITQSKENSNRISNEEKSVSDMIKFSTNSLQSVDLPVTLESKINNTEANESERGIPQLSVLLNHMDNKIPIYSENSSFATSNSENTEEESSESETNINPAFSQLLDSSAENKPHKVSSSQVLPDFSMLGNSENSEGSIDYLPDFNAIQISTTKDMSVNTYNLSTGEKSRLCTSPLPNLSLITILPHFNYFELEDATNHFDERPFTSEAESGRLLGSGAYGSVFLALNLLDRPVAVKKLILENVEVNVDDTVTKQFRTEVEVLSKYRHDNLLSIIGYSCDGYTYCLMYEYVPGGALKTRLQGKDKLHWKDRLGIALGTSRAVKYLHTAFETPLIHRDIKSSNILLESTNNPKLCDFGLIKLSPNQNTSTTTTVFGTSAYMAPEAFRGDISVKLDTFSFGVVLLELLTSLSPMDENREGADLVTHVGENCDDGISSLLDNDAGLWIKNDINYADKLFEIALNCLQEKKKRPNMVTVNAELEDFLQNIELSMRL